MNARTNVAHRLRLLAPSLLCCIAAGVAHARGGLRIGWKIPGETYVNAWGVDPQQQHADFGENKSLRVKLVRTSAPANILWPGEKLELVFQFENLTDARLALTGAYDLDRHRAYDTSPRGLGTTGLRKLADVARIPLSVEIPAGGYRQVTVSPGIPETFGGYLILIDIEGQGRFFGAGVVRARKNVFPKTLYRRFTMDAHSIDQMKRLAAYPNRKGLNWKPVTDEDFEEWYRTNKNMVRLREFQDAGMTVTVEFGHCVDPKGPRSPIGRVRPHLDEKGVMKQGKADYSWMPQFDEQFEDFVYRLCSDYGYPRGGINGVMLWNEPWEGLSISGWGADCLRYREIYAAMARGVERARADAGVDVLIGGCDSTSNTFDKLLPDGDEWLRWLDFMSIHYQANNPSSTCRMFLNRKHHKGRVLVWDTESWISNTEDGVASMVAGCASFGYDRIVGVYGGGTINLLQVRERTPDGKTVRKSVPHAWPINAALAAAQSFVGERHFRELLFKNGLPYVMVFDGYENAGRDDGTVVVVGDLARVFGGSTINYPYRSVRCLAEIRHEAELRKRLAALPSGASEERAELEHAIAAYDPMSECTMTLDDAGGAVRMFGTYGNRIPSENGTLRIPLTGEGVYLRGDGSPGSFEKLLAAVRGARIDGFEPLATVCRDMTKPVDEKPELPLELTNILNRPISGRLAVALGSLEVAAPANLSFDAHETKTVAVEVTGGTPSPDNTYPLSLTFDAGADGTAVHEEDMHVNPIHARAIAVDGDLGDWKGALPQPIRQDGATEAGLAEIAWFPYEKLPASIESGFATAYLAHDDEYFYFAAKIADNTPHEGTWRFENRDDDAFFYPEVSVEFDTKKSLVTKEVIGDADRVNTKLLAHPTNDGERVNGEWQYELPSTAFGIDIEVPKGSPQRVSLFIPPWHSHGMALEVFDLDRNRRIGRQTARGDRNYNGQYMRCNIQGRVRFRLSGPSHKRVAVAGVFFDPPIMKGKKPEKAGRFADIDYDTSGDWKGTYGANGYQIVGVDAALPSGVTLSVPHVVERKEHVWPEGVRRYSYRRHPHLPSGGQGHRPDNVQIAFNAIPAGDPDGVGGAYEFEAFPPGTRWQYTNYKCTDYEYALNKVAEEHGGGTEIYRLRVPGQPHKHHYPRQPKHELDGPVKDGKLVMTHEGNTRIVECAIPWSELPHVTKLRDEGKPVKFSCRINDSAGRATMELARERSVSKRNNAFHVDWNEHWANEVAFAFEPVPAGMASAMTSTATAPPARTEATSGPRETGAATSTDATDDVVRAQEEGSSTAAWIAVLATVMVAVVGAFALSRRRRQP